MLPIPDPLNPLFSITSGILTNIATDLLKQHTQALENTLVGHILKKAGLIEPSFYEHLRDTLSKSLELYFELYPQYRLTGIEAFFSDPMIAKQIGDYILDRQPIDQHVIQSAFERHLEQYGIVKALLHQRGIDAMNIIPDFLKCYRRILMKQLSMPQTAILLEILEQASSLVAEIRASEERMKEYIAELVKVKSSSGETPTENEMELGELQSDKDNAATPRVQRIPSDLGLIPLPEYFVGRSAELRWLLQRLRGGGVTGITALRGMGGIGKTTLATVAVHYLHKEGLFPDGIVVIPCQDLTNAINILKRIFSRFDPHQRQPEINDSAVAFEIAHRLIDGKKVLIMLDNIEPGLIIEDVVLPLCAAGATLLLTSRHMLPHSIVPMGANQDLDLLSAQEALALLIHSLGRNPSTFTTAEYEAAERIVSSLDRHTLAVKLVGAYAADLKRDLETLAEELKDPSYVIEIPNGEIPHAIALVFAKSTKALPLNARQLFTALAAFSTVEFGRQAALALAKDLHLNRPEQSLNLLVSRALVEAFTNDSMLLQSGRERLRLHPLLHALASAGFAHWSEKKRSIAHYAIARYYATYSNEMPDRALGPDELNITGSLEWSQAHHQYNLIANLCLGMQSFWRIHGRTAASLRYLPWGVMALESLLGIKLEEAFEDFALVRVHANWERWVDNLFWLLLNEGIALHLTGQVDAAKRRYQHCTALAKQADMQRNVGVGLDHLGWLARDCGWLEEAARYFKQSLEIAREVGNRSDEGTALAQLGRLAQWSGQEEEAIDYFERALEIAREEQDHRSEGMTLSQLGRLAQWSGQVEKAEIYYQQSLQILREVQDRQGQGLDLARLGQVAQLRQEWKKAENYYQQALEIDREVQDRRAEGLDFAQLGWVLQAQGRMKEAESCYLQSLQFLRDVQDRRGEGLDLARLGWIAKACGWLEKAENYYQQSLQIRRELQDHQGEAVDLKQLGIIADARGQWDEAENYFRQCLAIMRAIHNEQNEDSIALLLGRFLIQRGRNKVEGCQLLLRAVCIRHELGFSNENEALQVAQEFGCIQ